MNRKRYNSIEATIKSFLLIARKHDLDPKLLIEAFFEAWRYKVSLYKGLKVSFRDVNQDSAYFLVTNDDKVISQFPIEQEILRHPNLLISYLNSYLATDSLKKKVEKKQRKISELRFGMRKVSVRAKVIEVPPMRLVTTRFGSQSYVSNVKVADETGSINLSLWNKQIEKVHVGDEIDLKNCYVSVFRDEPQLRIGRKGTISIIEQSSLILSKKPS